MKKLLITVRDYHDALHGSAPWHYKEGPIVTLEVEAYCVGGAEGIRAYFFYGDLLCEAHGDDGHWWLMSCCSHQWLPNIVEALKAINEETKP